MAEAKFSILFLCRWNAGRSIFAEYFMRELGAKRFEVFSAGVTPLQQVSPVTLKILQDKFQIDTSDARSKSWREFEDRQLDFIVTLSEEAKTTSQAFPGKPILANWPFRDPRKTQGSAKEVEDSYYRVAAAIRHRLQLFNNFSFDQLDRLRLETSMKGLAGPGSSN
jgi:arsenate reductase (thioredoxin)